jgi:hypothetical protein
MCCFKLVLLAKYYLTDKIKKLDGCGMQPSWQDNIRATLLSQNLHGSNHLTYLYTTAVVLGGCKLDSTG